VMVVEVMGRHSGWIAVHSGIAGGADLILIPEQTPTIAEVIETIKKRHARGKSFSIIVVAEGVTFADDDYVVQESGTDEFGHVKLGGVGQLVSDVIEKETGFETRVTVLGHLQRGGTPTAFDRVLGTRYGIAAIDLVQRQDWGKMVALQGNQIVTIPLEDGIGELKMVDDDLYNIAKVFFG